MCRKVWYAMLRCNSDGVELYESNMLTVCERSRRLTMARKLTDPMITSTVSSGRH